MCDVPMYAYACSVICSGPVRPGVDPEGDGTGQSATPNGTQSQDGLLQDPQPMKAPYADDMYRSLQEQAMKHIEAQSGADYSSDALQQMADAQYHQDPTSVVSVASSVAMKTAGCVSFKWQIW